MGRYLSKIVFTYILGYQVDVGHMEAVNLISSPKYSEKQIVSHSQAVTELWTRENTQGAAANDLLSSTGLPGTHPPHARELRPRSPRYQIGRAHV